MPNAATAIGLNEPLCIHITQTYEPLCWTDCVHFAFQMKLAVNTTDATICSALQIASDLKNSVTSEDFKRS